VRVLAIETSTRRGSVAIADDGNVLGALFHEELNAHAERVLGLIEELLASAGWARGSLDRVAVGVGPGSFTGLRVGIALAQGIALGLGRPILGVGSLRAMASALPTSDARARIAVLDARRSELFVAAYAPNGDELLAPNAIPIAEVEATLKAALAGRAAVLVGEGATLLGGAFALERGPELDLPHAAAVARLGTLLDPKSSSAEPMYVRGPGATPQVLPPSPLG
jgi:tRNA threonylcarbamoyladenosine biosynthesis protein TsaB